MSACSSAREKAAGGLLDLQKVDLSGCYLGYVDLTGAIMTEVEAPRLGCLRLCCFEGRRLCIAFQLDRASA
eukprot:995802-Pleurochrysis_carterae.AAC.6